MGLSARDQPRMRPSATAMPAVENQPPGGRADAGILIRAPKVTEGLNYGATPALAGRTLLIEQRCSGQSA